MWLSKEVVSAVGTYLVSYRDLSRYVNILRTTGARFLNEGGKTYKYEKKNRSNSFG